MRPNVSRDILVNSTMWHCTDCDIIFVSELIMCILQVRQQLKTRKNLWI